MTVVGWWRRNMPITILISFDQRNYKMLEYFYYLIILQFYYVSKYLYNNYISYLSIMSFN